MTIFIILDSGNYAIRIYNLLKNQGIMTEVVSVPCKIARTGCSLCLKSTIDNKDLIIKECNKYGLKVREIYSVTYNEGKSKYKILKDNE